MNRLSTSARLVGISLFVSMSSLAQAQPQAKVLPRADGSLINYYLQPPSQPPEGEQELLLIVQGSDCNSVGHKAVVWQTLSQARPQAHVLAVEKYALTMALPYSDQAERSDCPAAYVQHDSPKQRVADLNAVLKQVLDQQTYRHVFALGGSEGAVIVHMLAAEQPRLDAAISFNGGGRWFEEDVLHSAVRQDMPAEDKQAMLAGLRGFLSQARDGMDTTMSDHGRIWWQEMLNIDQATLLSRIRIPVLVIQSGRDTSVSPEAAARMLAQVDNKHLSWRSYPDLDHGLNQPDGQSAMASVVADMAQWLNQTVLTKF